MSESLAAIMKAKLVEIEKRAKAVGSNMTQVCRDTGIARVTYERWMYRAPQSVAKVDALDAHVRKLEDAAGVK